MTRYLCQTRAQRPIYTRTVAPVWRAELSSAPGGMAAYEVRRWACCGLRRTGGPWAESRFWGVFIIAVQ